MFVFNFFFHRNYHLMSTLNVSISKDNKVERLKCCDYDSIGYNKLIISCFFLYRWKYTMADAKERNYEEFFKRQSDTLHTGCDAA